VATGLSMMAGASDQKAIKTTRKPAILKDANVGNCPSMRNRRTRVSTAFASTAPSATVRRKTVTSTRTLTLYLSAATRERPVLCALGGDSRPDAFAGFDQDAGAHQTFDDASGRFRGNLQGIAQPRDGDQGGAAVDDFFENCPDDLSSASGITTVEFHNASSDSWGYR